MAKLDVAFNRLVTRSSCRRADRVELIGIFANGGPHVLGLHIVSVFGFGLSTVLGVWLLWGVLRSGRL